MDFEMYKALVMDALKLMGHSEHLTEEEIEFVKGDVGGIILDPEWTADAIATHREGTAQ